MLCAQVGSIPAANVRKMGANAAIVADEK